MSGRSIIPYMQTVPTSCDLIDTKLLFHLLEQNFRQVFFFSFSQFAHENRPFDGLVAGLSKLSYDNT